jgi:hypothetical protein
MSMRLPILTITACAALGLGACGGDDEEVTLPSTTIPTATGATGATGEGGAAGSGAAVEDALTDGGFGIQSVDCPDDVPLEEGDTFDCDFTIESGESGSLSITVDSADEQSATLSYQSDSPQVEGEGVDVEK